MENTTQTAERLVPGINGADFNDDIFITENAIEALRSVKSENSVPDDMFLRLGTRGGGCSGMNYMLGFDTQVNDNDRTFKIREQNIVIDNKSLFYLLGVTLDYVSNQDGSGFVFNNPYNEKVCGCSH